MEEKLTDTQKKLIDGSMLGDGCLYVPKNSTYLTNPKFSCKFSINMDYEIIDNNFI